MPPPAAIGSIGFARNPVSTRILGQKREDERVMPHAPEPDRLARPPLEHETAAHGESLRRLVLDHRAHLEPSDALPEEPVADEPRRARHQPAAASARAGEVGELPVVARPARGDQRAEREPTALRNREVDPLARRAALAIRTNERVEVAIARVRRHVQPACHDRVAHRLEHGCPVALLERAQHDDPVGQPHRNLQRITFTRSVERRRIGRHSRAALAGAEGRVAPPLGRTVRVLPR